MRRVACKAAGSAVTGVMVSTFCLLSLAAVAQQQDPEFCDTASGGTAYSNAFIHEETGDTLGYAVVLKSGNKAVLYVYEGGLPSVISLPFKRTGKRIVIQGTWHERLTESPSGREVVRNHAVLVDGTVSGSVYKASISIGDWGKSQVRMKQVANILGCPAKV